MLWYEWFLIAGTIVAWSVALMHYRYFNEYDMWRFFKPKMRIDPFDYMFKPVPKGYFTARQPYINVFAWLGALQCVLGFLWMLVCVPDMRGVALVYSAMSIMVAGVYLICYYKPDMPMDLVGVMALGWCCWEDQTLAGILLSIPFIVASFFVTVPMQIKNMPIASFIVTVIMIPMVEEGLFRGVLAPSVAEFAGIFHGAMVSAVAFGIMHAYVYKLDWVRIFIVTCFGFVASMVDFKFDSILPSTVAHAIVNAMAYLRYI